MTLRVRATVLKAPDGTPGLLSVAGEERSYCMTGVWRSSTPPVPAQHVDAIVDETGRVHAIVVVDARTLAWERTLERTAALRRRAELLARTLQAHVFAVFSRRRAS